MAWSLTNPKAVCRREKRTRCGGGRADPTPGTRGPHWERADPMALGFGNQTGRTSRVLTTSGAEHLKLQTSGSALGRGTEPQRSGRRLEGCPRTSEPVPGGRGSLGDPSENERAGRCHLPPAHPQPRHAETRRSSAALRTCTRHPQPSLCRDFWGSYGALPTAAQPALGTSLPHTSCGPVPSGMARSPRSCPCALGSCWQWTCTRRAGSWSPVPAFSGESKPSNTP